MRRAVQRPSVQTASQIIPLGGKGALNTQFRGWSVAKVLTPGGQQRE
jgi:hypothetical protein